MNNQHTPGPWRLGKTSAQTVYGPPEEGYENGRSVASCGAATGRKLAEQTANARLIAAAPDLLAALEALLDDGIGTYANGEGFARLLKSDDDETRVAIKMGWDAIAKAKGGAS